MATTRRRKQTPTPAKKRVVYYRVKVKLTQSGTTRRMTGDEAKRMKAKIKRKTPTATVSIVKA